MEIAIGPCLIHGGPFMFDPETVPSVLVDPEYGQPPDTIPGLDADGLAASVARAYRRPVCPACCAKINPLRIRAGNEPLTEGPRRR